ncbi:two component system sensor histidine kinase [Desulfosarcina variabilis str. Montpellier]|uniref:sensor histidine kinase n=1 Tax=Desulfosarcina variabilis TaxID=2300 RepID=UPI003AFB0DD2
MKKLRLTMIVFVVLISLPLAVVVWRTFGALDREARSQVRFFAEQLLDEIEAELSHLVRQEEDRAVDEYRHTMVQSQGTVVSPLARLPDQSYILGYFQNNPDGSFQTPLVEDGQSVPFALAQRFSQLKTFNQYFNQRKRDVQDPLTLDTVTSTTALPEKKASSDFKERFLKSTERKKSKTVLGQKKARVEEITAVQAMNVARQDRVAEQAAVDEDAFYEKDVKDVRQDDSSMDKSQLTSGYTINAPASRPRMSQSSTDSHSRSRFQVEVAPLQTVVMDSESVFVFRRIVIEGQIFRQGFVLALQPFLDHLLATFYAPQPIARYIQLIFNAAGRSVSGDGETDPARISAGEWITARTFPAPFNFLTAQIRIKTLPVSPARRVLILALTVLGVVMVVGLVLIYQNARAVMDLSERRARFVSAVTHELKTPLTNIRMYVEMLDQGIAATPEREQAYLDVLASESARLSGLINNVLELSHLEKQTRRFNLSEGDLTDVLSDVQSIMGENLAWEGFELTIDQVDRPVFAYDRDVLVQVLLNLLENSIKFGRHLPQKKIRICVRVNDGWVRLMVSDTGPGIPRQSLKKVFDDFYRVDNDLVRTIGGTGIGLALVKKLILAMGGRVQVENNQGPGCTIILSLPANRHLKKT